MYRGRAQAGALAQRAARGLVRAGNHADARPGPGGPEEAEAERGALGHGRQPDGPGRTCRTRFSRERERAQGPMDEAGCGAARAVVGGGRCGR
jgi:hypothetical protein